MFKKFIIIILGLIIVCGSFSYCYAEEASLTEELLCDLGREFYEEGNLKDAKQEFEKVLSINPKNETALRYLDEINKEELSGVAILDKEQAIELYKIKLDTQKDKIIAEALDKAQEYLTIKGKKEQALLQQLIEEEVARRKKEKQKQIIQPRKDTVLQRLIEQTLEELEKEQAFGQEALKIAEKPIEPKEAEEEPIVIKKVSREDLMEELLEDISIVEPVSEEVIEKTYFQSVLINGEEIILRYAPEIRRGEILLPFKEMARSLLASIIDLGDDKYKIITSIAKTQEVEITQDNVIDGQAYISITDLDRLFDTESIWDPAIKTIDIKADYIFPAFTSYTIMKPIVEVPSEQEFAPTIVAYAEDIPEAARPSVELRADTYYSYKHTSEKNKPFRSSILNLSGRLYDYKLTSSLEWRDINDNVGYNTGYIDLYKDDIRFSILDQSINLNPIRSQSEGYSGIKLSKNWEDPSLRTRIYAGETETSVSGATETVKYIGNVYALEQEYNLKDWVKFRGMALATTNEAEDLSLAGTTSFPKHNLVFFGDTAFKLPYDVSLFGQLATANYVPDDGSSTSVNDFNYRIGSKWNKEKINFEGFYEYVGDRYASIGTPESYQDYKGWDFNTSYQLTDNWSLSNFVRISQDNVDGDPDESTTENTSVSLSTHYNFPTRQSVTIMYSADDTETDSSQQEEQESRSNLYRVDFLQPFFGGSDLLLTYEYYDFDATTSEGDYVNEKYGISLFKSFSGGNYFRWRSELKDLDKVANNEDSFSYNNELSFNLMFTPTVSLTNDFNWDYTNHQIDPTTSVFSNSLRLKHKLNAATDLEVIYAINNYDIKVNTGTPDDWSITGRFRKSFDIAGSPNFGKIVGRVASDINGNKVIDFDEPGIEDVYVKLEDGRKAKTDARGYFSFDRVVPGEQKVSLEFEDIPIELGIQGNSEKITFVNARKSAKVEFLLVAMGYIEGRLFIDENKNGKYDSDDEPLDGVIVSLLPIERRTTTTKDGKFLFDYIYPQIYTVQLDTTNLPKEYMLASPDEWKVDVPIGGKVKNVDFVLKDKPYKIKKFDSDI